MSSARIAKAPMKCGNAPRSEPYMSATPTCRVSLTISKSRIVMPVAVWPNLCSVWMGIRYQRGMSIIMVNTFFLMSTSLCVCGWCSRACPSAVTKDSAT